MLIKKLNNKISQDVSLFLEDLNKSGKFVDMDLSKFKPQDIVVNQPKNKSFGDLSTNAAMVLAPVLKQNPLKIASLLKDKVISGWDEISKVDIVAPGFLNLEFKKTFVKKEISKIPALKDKYGSNNSGKGQKITIEFVSANPTGKLHIGHGRWGALGDSLSNIYAENGYDVWREYYINDYGSQIIKYAQCISSIYAGEFGKKLPYPEDGYPKELVAGIVKEIINEHKDKFLKNNSPGINDGKFQDKKNHNNLNTANSPDSFQEPNYNLFVQAEQLGKLGVDKMILKIESVLNSMSVKFDQWFRESSLYEGTNFEDTLAELKKKKIVYEKDKAFWFKASEFGDDKDRVIIRTGGEPTYFASDIMYFINKTRRGFKKLVYILGADHHGYVKRIHAIGKALGFDDDNAKVIIGQLVRLVKKGQAVRMSKRKGEVCSLDELIDEAGSDAIRFFFSANSFDTHMDFDLDLAKQKSNANPVYYVQYAHARIASVIEKISALYNSGELIYDKNETMLDCLKQKENTGRNKLLQDFASFGKIFELLLNSTNFNSIDFENDEELNLAKILLLYPDIVYDACCKDAPYLINQYLYKVAASFHYFYNHYRIIDENRLHSNRFKIILITRTVLSNAMKILGVSLPVKM